MGMRLREHGDLPHQSRPIPLDYPSARQQTRKIAREPSAAGCGNILTARVTRESAAARINSNRYPHSHHRSSASLFSDQDSVNAGQQRGKQREQILKRSRTRHSSTTHISNGSAGTYPPRPNTCHACWIDILRTANKWITSTSDA